MRMDHEEARSLLGAYALHAVEPEEAEAVESHLAECPRCDAELAEYLATAPLLGSTGGEPPEGLWELVVASIDQPSMPGMRRSVLRATRSPRLANPFILGGVAAGAAAAIVALALSVTSLEGRVNDLERQPVPQALNHALSATLAAPHHQVIYLSEPSGRREARVVVGSDDRAYFQPTSMPRLAAGRTYQLWTLSQGKVVSLGVLGRSPELTAIRVEPHMSALMITAEPSGGVPQPDSPVLALGSLKARGTFGERASLNL
jgi:anti-sigma factor RsiW